MKEGDASLTFIDDPHAPEFFASDVCGLFLSGDTNIVITFESCRVDHATSPGPVNRVVVARVVLPISAAQNLVVGLNAFLEQRGLSPSEAAQGGLTAQ
jgi:hypothetical protein